MWWGSGQSPNSASTLIYCRAWRISWSRLRNGCNLIVTTHSDILIGGLTDNPEAVVVCEKGTAPP